MLNSPLSRSLAICHFLSPTLVTVNSTLITSPDTLTWLRSSETSLSLNDASRLAITSRVSSTVMSSASGPAASSICSRASSVSESGVESSVSADSSTSCCSGESSDPPDPGKQPASASTRDPEIIANFVSFLGMGAILHGYIQDLSPHPRARGMVFRPMGGGWSASGCGVSAGDGHTTAGLLPLLGDRAPKTGPLLDHYLL